MKQNLNGVFVLMSLMVLSMSACSEPALNNQDDLSSVSPGNWLAIDEYNQILNRVDLETYEVEQITYVGNAANDIEVADGKAYVISSLNNTLFELNMEAGGIRTLPFPNSGSPDYESGNPWGLCINGNRIYVTLSVINSLAVVDRSGWSVISNIALPDPGYPEGIAAYGNNLFVTSSIGYLDWGDPGNYSNSQLIMIDASNYNIITNIPMMRNAQFVALDTYGNAYVACTGTYNTNTYSYENGGLVRVSGADLSTNVLDDSVCPNTVKIDSDRLYALLANYGGLNVYDTNGTFITNLLPGKDLKGVDYNDDYIYVQNGYAYADIGESFQISKSGYGISVISNTGGGDAALYQ